jgi:hypothetical protein
MSTTESNAEVMAKRGDVILQLGKVGVGEGVRNILVASMVLSLASPVFANMFDGRFSEGQNLSPNSPRIVPLPDDDPESIIIICKICHIQTSNLPVKLTATAFSKLALVCNKYDCVDLVRAWAMIWVAALLDSPSAPGFEKMILATHLLDLPNEFSKVSQSLIRDQSAILSISKAMDGHDILPCNVYECILMAQVLTQREITRVMGSIVTGHEQCGASKQAIGVFLLVLKQKDLLSLSHYPVLTVKHKLKSVHEVNFPVNSNPCPSHKKTCTCKHASCMKSNLIAELDRIYDSVTGLCLDCVRHKALGETKI